MLTNSRVLLGLISLACLSMIVVALYMQHVMYLHPCNLCIVQRVAFIITGIIAFIGVLHTNKRRLWASLTALAAAVGSLFSMRQLYLQGLPPEDVPACGPGLEYLFEALPFQKAVEQLLMGDGNCAEVQWTFLTISIPGWALISFIGIVAVSLFAAKRA